MINRDTEYYQDDASDGRATTAIRDGQERRADVALVGFDDSPPVWMTTPALSTVHQPVEKLACGGYCDSQCGCEVPGASR